MGILNCTPNSFSDGGEFLEEKKEVKEKPAPAVKEKAPESEANILHPIDELLLQNRMLIAEIKKQGERVDTVLNILKSKI